VNPNAPVSRSGRFSGGPGSDVAQFTQSISFDWRVWEQDVLGSLAHAAMLQKIGVLTKSELLEIENALNEIAQEICEDRFPWRQELEDVHMNIESELTRRAPAGAKLHTGRSRNDQISLDMRMWLRDEIVELNRDIRLLQRALLGPGIPTCNALSRFLSLITRWRTWRCSNATMAAWPIAFTAPMCVLWAAAPLPGQLCLWTGKWLPKCSGL
jgi:hypothetical protein